MRYTSTARRPNRSSCPSQSWRERGEPSAPIHAFRTMDSRGREPVADRHQRRGSRAAAAACGRRRARLSRTGNKAAAIDCLPCRSPLRPARRSAARGHVTAAAHQPLRAAARELEIGWDIPPAGRPLGSAWRRGHELGGAAVHGFFSSPQLVRVPGASAGLSVCQRKPRAWSPNEASST